MLNAHLIEIMASNPNKYKYCKPGGCQASVNNKYVSNIYLLIIFGKISYLFHCFLGLFHFFPGDISLLFHFSPTISFFAWIRVRVRVRVRIFGS